MSSISPFERSEQRIGIRLADGGNTIITVSIIWFSKENPGFEFGVFSRKRSEMQAMNGNQFTENNRKLLRQKLIPNISIPIETLSLASVMTFSWPTEYLTRLHA